METLLGLLYGLSNQSLGGDGRKTLAAIMEAPAWDMVLPHLRDALAMIDSSIVQSIAEGLFKKAIHSCHHKMLDLSLSLGADSTQRMRHFDPCEMRFLLYTPLGALYNQHHRRPLQSLEKLILSLLKRDQSVPNTSLLWIIRVRCYAIAEHIIRSQPGRKIDFAIATSDLEGGWRLNYNTFNAVTPLLVACSDPRQSAEKLSLIRCLLDRNAKATLEAMIAAAGACDGKVISLLHQHGAPVNGFIPTLGSPLSSACTTILGSSHIGWTGSTAISLLINLGASPKNLNNDKFGRWKDSPLHILALAEECPAVTEALDLLIEHGADINRRARLYRSNMLDVYPRPYGKRAQTALEYAIESSRWLSAICIMSAGCELTGREIFFINSTMHNNEAVENTRQEKFKEFVGALLARAPGQVDALHWSGLTVLQRAIQNDHEDLILALFAFGMTPMPSDFLHMLRCRKRGRVELCPLSCSIQMKLVLAAKLPETTMTDISIARLILGFACPEVVRHILHVWPYVYDSKGLCYMIARLVSKNKTTYLYLWNDEGDQEGEKQTDSLSVDDLHAYVRRRTMSNRDEDWESTAIAMAARAGRADILQILFGSNQQDLRRNGWIPHFLLKEFLIYDSDKFEQSGMKTDLRNWHRLGVWIKCCRMDHTSMMCSPLTAAALVVPESLAQEVFDLLLEFNYQPDGWTVLVASCQGRLSILQRLKRLECWPYILSHEHRPDWCPTALQMAVHRNHVSTVRFLLDAGTFISTMDLSPCQPIRFITPDEFDFLECHTILPRTALQHAVEKCNMELVTLLSNSGANVNAPPAMDSGATALQIASIQGSIPMLQYLISKGADPKAASAAKYGRTALQGAAEYGRKDVVELLLAHEALTEYRNREQLVEAIFYAEKNAYHLVAETLRRRILPPWRSEDEETLNLLQKDRESSSGNSAFEKLVAEFDAWRNASEEWPEPLQLHESSSNSRSRRDQTLLENPLPFQEEGFDFWLPQEMGFGFDGNGGLDVGQIGEVDFYDGDVVTWLAAQEESAARVDELPSFEGVGLDHVLFNDFSFGSFI